MMQIITIKEAALKYDGFQHVRAVGMSVASIRAGCSTTLTYRAPPVYSPAATVERPFKKSPTAS